MTNKKAEQQSIKALTEWSGSFGLPDFNAFSDEDFVLAFQLALQQAEQEIETLASDPQTPTIEQFLIPFELAGHDLDRVCSLFFAQAGACSNNKIQELERDFAPKLAQFSSKITLDERLFTKINILYQERDHLNLDAETYHVLEEHWKNFVRNGANLTPEGKKRLAEIGERLSVLFALFGQNILKDNDSFVLYLDNKQDLEGLPDDLLDSMQEAARERGKMDHYALTLTRSILIPFLTFSDQRPLREIAFKAWIERGAKGGETDNRALIAEIVQLRDEKAKLLGFSSFAALALDQTMAKTPSQVMDLLLPVWEKAKTKFTSELLILQDFLSSKNVHDKIQPWDWRYWSEKLKKERHHFDENELKPYFQLDSVIEAAFFVAKKLFGLTFEEQNHIPLWHEDARIWLVTNQAGERQGLFIGDYFARSSKQSGAWMSSLQNQHKIGTQNVAIVYNICNFAKSGSGKPTLLTLEDARTLFHEFGHALHGLLSDVKWPSISGTSVVRDFVELPSQLYEHWLTVPEVIEKFARHYQTKQAMPPELLQKVLATKTLNSGFDTIQYTSSALIDMAFHTSSPTQDPIEFEQRQLEQLGMPLEAAMMHRSSHFNHIFSGGYAAGYYSYMWSEVLDVDAFSAFEESGDVFHPQLAHKLKEYIYSAGGRADASFLYQQFRGKLPSAEAMIKQRGLIDPQLS